MCRINNALTSSIIAGMVLCTSFAYAKNKIDAGPVYINMHVLNYGKTTQILNMGGVRADSTLQPFSNHPWLKGILVKPTITLAEGDGSYFCAGLGLGQCVPVTDTLTFSAVVGILYSSLKTRTNLPDFGLSDLRQKTTGTTPYVGLEAYYKPCDDWLLSGSVQYGWSSSRTTLQDIGFSEGSSKGPSYSLMADYYMTPCWSINAALGYNRMLSQELHGFRALGARLGVGYTF